MCVEVCKHMEKEKKIEILLISEGRYAHVDIPCTKHSCSAQEV